MKIKKIACANFDNKQVLFSNMWQFTYSGRHFHMEINNWALQKKIQKEIEKTDDFSAQMQLKLEVERIEAKPHSNS